MNIYDKPGVKLISRRRIPVPHNSTTNQTTRPLITGIDRNGLVLLRSDNYNNEESTRELLSCRREIGSNKD